MKTKTKQIIVLTAIITLSICAFIGCSFVYIYLKSNLSAEYTDKTQSLIPYSNVPKAATISFIFPDDSGMLLTLDFENGSIGADFSKDRSGADFTVKTENETISGFIDRIGGIEIPLDGTVYRYTGLQAVRLSQNGYVTKPQVVKAVFSKIAANGITRDQLKYLFSHSHTELTMAQYYSWPEWLKEMCVNTHLTE